VPVVLGASYRAVVESRAQAGESYFLRHGQWIDLTTMNKTANFCMKGLSVDIN
jgi:hypothetical protein